MLHLPPFDNRRFVKFDNNSGSVVPPHAALEVTGTTYTAATGEIVWEVTQPTEDDLDAGLVLFNSHEQVGIGEVGAGTMDFPLVAYPDTGSFSAGDLVGTKDSSFGLIAGTQFVVQGVAKTGHYAIGKHIVGTVTPICQFYLDAALATTDASKSATVDRCNVASYVGDTITVYNHDESGGDYIFEGDSGDYGTAYYDQNNEKWYIIQMECP